jgi:hypothetical protein
MVTPRETDVGAWGSGPSRRKSFPHDPSLHRPQPSEPPLGRRQHCVPLPARMERILGTASFRRRTLPARFFSTLLLPILLATQPLIAPFILSPEVQDQAVQLRVIQDSFVRERGESHYLDLLTANDLIGRERAARAGRSLSGDDMRVGFAAVCVFVPNKPPVPEFIARAVRDSIRGLYTLQRKRAVFVNSLAPFLLEAGLSGILERLGRIKVLEDYEAHFIRVRDLVRYRD